jgi:hypothetical protein
MNQRPTAITVICVLGFIGAGLTLLGLPLILKSASMFPGWYLPYLLVSAVVGLACMIGMWRMKKIAAMGYVGMTGLNQVILLVGGLWTPMALVIPAIVCGVAIANLSKMS